MEPTRSTRSCGSWYVERVISIVSPDGMLGRAFMEALADGSEPVHGVSFPVIDLRDEQSIERALADRPRVVINCAAYTDVDAAETHEADALAVNGHGVGRLARACRSIDATLVHFGTDYVFSGDATRPYPVDAPLAPRGAYGRSKAEGERQLIASGAAHLLVRTSWLYAPWAKNFVRTIAKAADEKDELRVVDDQRGRPTSAEGLARTTLALLDRDARGTFHATDDGECTWFELAAFIASERHSRARIVPCTTEEFPRPAPRPRYSVLDLSATHALAPAAPHWQVAVRDVLGRLQPW
jgi:dTDP-4-dehydrorhamnose reductase